MGCWVRTLAELEAAEAAEAQAESEGGGGGGGEIDPHDAERRTPLAQRLRNRLANPSKRRLLEALFALAHEMDEPFVVFLRSRGDAIFRSRSALVAVRDEFYCGLNDIGSSGESEQAVGLEGGRMGSNDNEVEMNNAEALSKRSPRSKVLFVLSTVEDLARRPVSVGHKAASPTAAANSHRPLS